MTIDVVIAVVERWDLYLAVCLMVAMTFQGPDELLLRCVKDVIENCMIGTEDINVRRVRYRIIRNLIRYWEKRSLYRG